MYPDLDLKQTTDETIQNGGLAGGAGLQGTKVEHCLHQ
jgi:hypothetical protein